MTDQVHDGRRRSHLTVAVAAVLVVVLLTGALLVRQLVVRPFVVPSASMEPTLQVGDVILADRGDRGQAQRGQVVVFDGSGYFSQDGDDASGRYWVKRVIAVGGDRVTCCTDAGAITVNGEAIEETYLPSGTAPSTIPFDLEVPEGRMFVLGDNRGDSTDSRNLLGAPGGGMIPVDRVVGSVHTVVWPLSRRGSV